MKNKLLKLLIKFQVIVLIGVIADQLTKLVARNNLIEGQSVVIINDFFSWTLVYNTGAAWSILPGQTGFFLAITVVIVALLQFYFLKTNNKILKTGILLCEAGALGNFIDRIAFAKVTDFISFVILGYDFPIFNVADILVVVGAIIIALTTILSDDNGEKESNFISENGTIVLDKESNDDGN